MAQKDRSEYMYIWIYIYMYMVERNVWSTGKCLGKPVSSKKMPLADTSMSDTLRASFFSKGFINVGDPATRKITKPGHVCDTNKHHPHFPTCSVRLLNFCSCFFMFLFRYRTASGSFNSFLLFILFRCSKLFLFWRISVNTSIFATLPSIIAGWPKCLRALITQSSKI